MTVSSHKIAVAVIGAGRFGSRHATAWAAHPRACLSAVVDPRPEARALAERLGAIWLPNLEGLPPQVAAVSLALPPFVHAAVGCRLLERGCHVLVEKPMATTLEEADRLLAAATIHQRILQVGHVERFNPAVEQLRRELDKPPIRLELCRVGPPPAASSRRDLVLDLMIHDIDLVLWLMGDGPEAVQVGRVQVGGQGLQEVEAELFFPSGRSARLLAGYRTGERVRHARVTTSPARHQRDLLTHLASRIIDVNLGTSAKTGNPQPLDREIDAFLRSIIDREAVAVTGLEGRAALAVALQIAAEASRRPPSPTGDRTPMSVPTESVPFPNPPRANAPFEDES